ncbi:MAG: histidine phosphatase family protein [Candidatus Heimdallarchaeota archaeon]|nr:histidine phosphatase family protein [Candidatus Heimdallarchaeota archaeon]MCG3256208.1 histidine phosphatase family protein [Candidatus Heimdallarchaeota archaeon]MCK4611278.1 histidine phosphatase family protein [Candidatus Heimdallarchaeota archaeon]
MRLFLVRHGETDHNKNRVIMGHLPTPLNETGKDQVKILADELKDKGIQLIYSSDLVRAVETAEIISLELNLPVKYTDKLREHTLGDLDGVGISELLDEMESLKEFDDLMTKHNGELTEDFMTRVWEEFRNIARENKEKDFVLIVTHGGCVRSIIARILDASELIFDNIKQHNCCINIIDYTESEGKEKFSIELVNDVCHFTIK